MPLVSPLSSSLRWCLRIGKQLKSLAQPGIVGYGCSVCVFILAHTLCALPRVAAVTLAGGGEPLSN
jgi:hypothetical protein